MFLHCCWKNDDDWEKLCQMTNMSVEEFKLKIDLIQF